MTSGDPLEGDDRFSAVLWALRDGLAIIEDGRVVVWNQAATRLTGRSASQLIGGPSPALLEDAAEGKARSVTGADGRQRWLEMVKTDLPEGRGELWLLRDLTDQHALDEAKTLFFATTSHELKSPLTVVRGLAGTLRHHWRAMTPDQRDEALATNERRADHLDRLIERILVGSRVEAGAFEVTVGPCELADAIRNAVAGFSSVSERHTIEVSTSGNLPLVGGDGQALDTVLGHLIDNAIKYSPEGGTIVIRARPVHDPDRVVVEVSDPGIGIDGDLGLPEPLRAGGQRVHPALRRRGHRPLRRRAPRRRAGRGDLGRPTSGGPGHHVLLHPAGLGLSGPPAAQAPTGPGVGSQTPASRSSRSSLMARPSSSSFLRWAQRERRAIGCRAAETSW